MGNINFSMPRDIVVEFARQGNITNFVETGTYKGASSFWAAGVFKEVYTIEIDEAISNATRQNPGCPKNIRFFVGDSATKLKEVLSEISGRCLFWLDGHWCNVSEFGRENECPILDEIAAIADHENNHVILIDDARAFLGPLPPPHNPATWPRIDEIFGVLSVRFANHITTIVDDVIFCIPKDLVAVFDKYWVATYQKRFFPRKKFMGILRAG